MNITALDMSLTATGWAKSTDASGVLVPPKGHDRGMARLRWLRDSVLSAALGADLVVIEGYSFGSKGNAVINLGELGGVIRLALSDANKRYVEIPPSCVKLFATGKGNAPKDEVLAAAIRKLGYARANHNEADALWLLEMARAHYSDVTLRTESQDRALSKIEWPRIPDVTGASNPRVVVTAEAL